MLVKKRRSLAFSTSVTTRLPRPGERDGKDYFFVTDAAFQAMRKRSELVEWAKVHDHFYGTPRGFLEHMHRQGKDLLLDIDVQGAIAVKKHFPDAVLIFITTPTFADLEKRLRARCSESEAQIQRRLTNARRELAFIPRYDYLVVNKELSGAVRDLDSIFTAETLKIRSSRKKES
jgi:guanylate kinase